VLALPNASIAADMVIPEEASFFTETAIWRLLDVRFAPNAEVPASFDHLVGGGEQRRWNFEAQRPGHLEIDHQLVLIGCLYRKFTRLRPSEDAIYIDRCAPVDINRIRAIGGKAPLKMEYRKA